MSMSLATRHRFADCGDWRYAVSPLNAYHGTPGDDRIKGSAGSDQIDMSQGGDDFVNANRGDDSIYFGAAFTGADKVDGAGGIDTVTLDGDYSSGVDIQADSLTRIEKLILEGGPYVITGELNFQDDQGRTFVDGRTLAASQSLHLSVSASGDLFAIGGAAADTLDEGTQESSGENYLFGLDGSDILIGGEGEYHLVGGLGADRLTANSDQSVFEYTDISESFGKAHDTIIAFQGKILIGFDSDTDTSGMQHDFHFDKTADRTGCILFKYDAATDETVIKVFTGADHKADLAIHLTGDVPLTLADFIFG